MICDHSIFFSFLFNYYLFKEEISEGIKIYHAFPLQRKKKNRNGKR